MAIVIPLQLEGEQQIRTGLAGIRFAIQDFRSELAKLRADLRRPLPNVRGAGSAGGQSQAQQLQNIGRAAQQATGPMAALARANAQLKAALSTGDPNQVFDAQYRMHLASTRARRAQRQMNPDPWQAARNLLFSTRFNLGGQAGGVSPLIGRTMQALGGVAGAGGALAGVAVGAGAVVAVFTAISAAGAKLAEHFTGMSSARYAAGATYSQMGQLTGVGAAVGMTPQQTAAAARAFAEAIGQGGYAAGVARQFGMSDVNGPYGRINKADNLLKAIDLLTRLPEEQAIRFARSAGIEEFLPMRDASPDKLQELLNAQATLHTPEAARAAADFNIELAMLKVQLQSLLPYLTPVIRLVGLWAEQLRLAVQLIHAALTGNVSGAAAAAARMADNQRKLMDPRWWMGGDKKGMGDLARDRNTEAINENTRELRNVRETIGGGRGARGALPSQWRYGMINNQLDALANSLGAF